jgi:hypothetical protein
VARWAVGLHAMQCCTFQHCCRCCMAGSSYYDVAHLELQLGAGRYRVTDILPSLRRSARLLVCMPAGEQLVAKIRASDTYYARTLQYCCTRLLPTKEHAAAPPSILPQLLWHKACQQQRGVTAAGCKETQKVMITSSSSSCYQSSHSINDYMAPLYAGVG